LQSWQDMTYTNETTNNANNQSRDLDKPRLLKVIELILAGCVNGRHQNVCEIMRSGVSRKEGWPT
jgi:hypothetical protein